MAKFKDVIDVWKRQDKQWVKALMILLLIPVLILAAIIVWGSNLCYWISDQFENLGDWLNR